MIKKLNYHFFGEFFTLDLKSCDHCGRVGLSPTPGTNEKAAPE
jgi:hypothetical protein